jgi:hypothetical protein
MDGRLEVPSSQVKMLFESIADSDLLKSGGSWFGAKIERISPQTLTVDTLGV